MIRALFIWHRQDSFVKDVISVSVLPFEVLEFELIWTLWHTLRCSSMRVAWCTHYMRDYLDYYIFPLLLMLHGFLVRYFSLWTMHLGLIP